MPDQTHRSPGLVMTDHRFDVPLDYSQPDGAHISIFAREVVAPAHEHDNLPMLVFFQGGPGSSAPRPSDNGGWLGRALKEFRVLLLDQRGTGLSTPVNHQTLARFKTAREQADYLKHFRADNIVRDAEFIRAQLLGAGEKWSALGQSYGGFCITTYLSFAPEGLREAFITGGIPPALRTAEEVYRATYKRVLDKNKWYYERYPEDVVLVRQIVDVIEKETVCLPQGDPLTARRFQQIGMAFGASGGFEDIHFLLEQAIVDGANGRELNYGFLLGIEEHTDYAAHPIFAILHESIYGQGSATNWAAERVRAEYPAVAITPDQPVYFTGEMIFPWMFDEYRYLQPLKEAAELLAADDTWSPLY
ncbi:MAG: alpha/beta fold hydrolase, partial [Anaerolineae bacterium]|nr:alpha/beta fold hydrolase [Anaerolineae bacterium]